MSIAWSSIPLMFYLFPGLFFYYWYSQPGRKIRDIQKPLSTFEALLVVFLAAVLIHVLIVVLITFLTNLTVSGFRPLGWIPPVNIEAAFQVLDINMALGASKDTPNNLNVFHNNIAPFYGWIIGYFSIVTLVSWWFGIRLQYRYVKNADHQWAFDLSEVVNGTNHKHENKLKFFRLVFDDIWHFPINLWAWLKKKIAKKHKNKSTKKAVIIRACVMSNVQHDANILMYGGALDYFRLTPEGKFAYVILDNVNRFYMKLDEHAGPITTQAAHQAKIGASSFARSGFTQSNSFNTLVIEGEDIANLVYSEDIILVDEQLQTAEQQKARMQELREEMPGYEAYLEIKKQLNERNKDAHDDSHDGGEDKSS